MDIGDLMHNSLLVQLNNLCYKEITCTTLYKEKISALNKSCEQIKKRKFWDLDGFN